MQPLADIKIVEFSTMITASFAAMMMAEQGAQVIKVEPIASGDPMRYLGSSKGGISAIFANCNRGKRSLQLDLKSTEGVATVKKLVAQSDVVLCNYRPGVMDKLGLGSEVLRRLNPRLIYAAISGFGILGPDRERPAYDPVIQAQTGFTAVQGAGPQNPEFVSNLVCDKITAYTACQAVTAALYARQRHGEGQHIDLSMMDAGLYFLFPDGFMHQTLLDEDAEHSAPLSDFAYDLTPTKDGAITINIATSAQQVGAAHATEQPNLLADERFSSPENWQRNIGEFRALIKQACRHFLTAPLMLALNKNDVPAAKCMDYAEVINHPQYAANQNIDISDHPTMGQIRRIKPPAQFQGKRSTPASHTPALGQHTHEILTELGYTTQEIDQHLKQATTKGDPL